MQQTMLDLSSATLQAWRAKLPEDIRTAIHADIPDDDAKFSALAEAINKAEISELLDVVPAHAEAIEALGRVGRMRLLSHIVTKVYPFQVRVFHELLNAEDEEGGRSSTQILFIEDIKAFNDALAARLYTNSMDGLALEALQAAAYETEALPGLG
jgi:hypothetical protein